MLDQKLMMRLARLEVGVAIEMGITRLSDIQAILLPPRPRPHDLLAMFGYFGVVLHRGKKSERCILFKHVRAVTVPRMIRLVVRASKECWSGAGATCEPVLLLDRRKRWL